MLIAVVTVLSQLMGMVREGIIANYFGTSAEYDTLLLALTVPGIVASILFLVIPSAAIPSLQNSDAAHGKLSLISVLSSSFFRVTNLLTLAVTLALFFALPLVGKLIGSGISEEQADLVVRYGRIFCLLIPLKSYEAIFRSLLQVRHHFLFPAVAPLVFNGGVILFMVLLFPSLASQAFIIAMLLATLVQTVLVAVPFVWLSQSLQSDSHTSHNSFDTKSYIHFLATVTLIETIGVLADPFDRYIAGLYLDSGYVSATNYANITFFSPVRILIYSVSTAIFPRLAEYAAKNEKAKLAESYHRSLAHVIFFMIPATVFLYLFRNEIVHLLFERGKFDTESHRITVEILEYYLLAIPFFSAFLMQCRIFYALKSWLPFGIIRILAIGLKAVIGFTLIKTDWALALGGGTVLMFVFSALAAEFYFRSKLCLRLAVGSGELLAKSLLSAVIISFILWAIGYILVTKFELSGILPLVVTALIVMISLILLDRRLKISGLSIRNLFSKSTR